jgi:hypothetical protein
MISILMWGLPGENKGVLGRLEEQQKIYPAFTPDPSSVMTNDGMGLSFHLSPHQVVNRERGCWNCRSFEGSLTAK